MSKFYNECIELLQQGYRYTAEKDINLTFVTFKTTTGKKLYWLEQAEFMKLKLEEQKIRF